MGSSDLSISLGAHNLIGGLVLVVAGALLLASRGRPRKGAQAAAAPSAVAGLALHAQLGFTDPLLGGTATSAAYFLSVAVVAGCLGWDHQRDTLVRPPLASLRTPRRQPVPTTSRRTFLLGTTGLLALSACSGEPDAATATPPLGISAIPDQDPELLNRLYPALANRIADATDLKVAYKPVTDYTAVVRAFEVGDIHLAWMGGLTGVQARARVPGATAIVQRDIDADFHSLFIATKASGLKPFDDATGLTSLAGHTLTFGSETSTSGRLMPQYFMEQGGFDQADLQGSPGFSASHDATIEAVASGSFEVGAVNEQVWNATKEAGEVDLGNVVVLWRTPGYADYHWLARPDLDKVFGNGTTTKVTDFLLGLDDTDKDDAKILDLFGAKSFITTQNSNYDQIETVAKEQGLLA